MSMQDEAQESFLHAVVPYAPIVPLRTCAGLAPRAKLQEEGCWADEGAENRECSSCPSGDDPCVVMRSTGGLWGAGRNDGCCSGGVAQRRVESGEIPSRCVVATFERPSVAKRPSGD